MTTSARPGSYGRRGAVRSLQGRRVLVTGASGGLGAVLARRLYAEGGHVVLSGRRADELASLATELDPDGLRTRVVVADLADPEQVRRLAAEAGAVDVLVANAGLPANGELAEVAVQEVERIVDVNVRAVLVLTRLLLPGMLERRSGHVVILGSLAGIAGTPRSSLYNASKFALRGFGHALREELRGTGVSVSLVSPTYVAETGMWAAGGVRAVHTETTPGRVADACVRAVVDDRAEILVAPLTQRLAIRVAGLFPELMQPVLRSSAVPPAVIRAQRSRR